jgi:hypothetical protein
MFLMVLVLVILLVCSNDSIVIIVVLTSSLLSSCPSHPINIDVVAIANPPAVKVDCYIFDHVGAHCPPCLQQQQHCHCRHVVIIIVVVVSLSSYQHRCVVPPCSLL